MFLRKTFNIINDKLLNLRWVNMVAPWLDCLVCGFLRRQELRELRLLQKEEQRAQQQLSNKLQQQREQIYRRFEQETTVSQFVRTTVMWCYSIWPTSRKRAASSQSRSQSDGVTCMKYAARHQSVAITYMWSGNCLLINDGHNISNFNLSLSHCLIARLKWRHTDVLHS